MSGNSHDIKVLNGLVEGLVDSADGYHQAAVETADGPYSTWFEARAAERRRLAETFKAAVRDRGGSPEEDASILAKAQRAFMDVKHALLRNDASVLGTVETGEEQLTARFERALADEGLSATTKETIRRAYADVQQGREQLSVLKRGLAG
ncbi:NAD-dependent aldehyde dehydrogenases [Brevundimonas diminuta 3F5N]|uniref:NAD-dependent aldehyde dehydrogenases n=1 Tax=Brevundimonas diminuta 3F5N TaxID=1255603 RepID=A0A1R4FZY5_BREDI|nr:PA2169 family four-helix-bundle protein [Brevundimonas diminuta]SJM61465.1 NAD-dependent aldehyde dehydrogenases [Brevundimonas diminuta 3F5N]